MDSYEDQKNICKGIAACGILASLAKHPIIGLGLMGAAYFYGELLKEQEETHCI